MSEIEDLLKSHTDSVDEALTGFEGEVSTLKDLVKALSADVRAIGDRKVPTKAGGRLDTLEDVGPSAKRNRPTLRGFLAQQLVIPADERKLLTDIMRGVDVSMRIANGPEGGFLVPDQTREQIESLILAQSPLRRVAKVVNFTSGSTVLPINTRGTTAGWVDEDEERTPTAGPSLAALRPPGGTVYALPSATEELIDDAITNMEAFIEENVIDAIANMESSAFISGDGIHKPLGFMASAMPAPLAASDLTRPLGALQYVPSGDPANIPNSVMNGVLVSMIFALKAGYRQAPGTAWLASTEMIATLARITDDDGRPVFTPSLRENIPGVLLGFPVIEFEHMPDVTPGSFPLAFGNWQRGYVIGDRTPLNILRDPYTRKGRVLWYFRKRVHGCVLNGEAIKLLKVAAN
jgi:HK97 family phage major capsid protein